MSAFLEPWSSFPCAPCMSLTSQKPVQPPKATESTECHKHAAEPQSSSTSHLAVPSPDRCADKVKSSKAEMSRTRSHTPHPRTSVAPWPATTAHAACLDHAVQLSFPFPKETLGQAELQNGWVPLGPGSRCRGKGHFPIRGKRERLNSHAGCLLGGLRQARQEPGDKGKGQLRANRGDERGPPSLPTSEPG